jgi:hypothetical protein
MGLSSFPSAGVLDFQVKAWARKVLASPLWGRRERVLFFVLKSHLYLKGKTLALFVQGFQNRFDVELQLRNVLLHY